MLKLYVCQTCRRDEPLAAGARSRGQQLADALGEALGADAPGITLLRIACLNGCLNPCNVSLRAPRKYSLRFSRLTAADAPALVALLDSYRRSEDGDVPESAMPQSLAGHLSARVPPPHLLLG